MRAYTLLAGKQKIPNLVPSLPPLCTYLEDEGEELIGGHTHQEEEADFPSVRHRLGQLDQEEEEEGGEDDEEEEEGEEEGGHVSACLAVVKVCVEARLNE